MGIKFKPSKKERIEKLEESELALRRQIVEMNKRHEALITKLGLTWVQVGYLELPEDERYAP